MGERRKGRRGGCVDAMLNAHRARVELRTMPPHECASCVSVRVWVGNNVWVPTYIHIKSHDRQHTHTHPLKHTHTHTITHPVLRRGFAGGACGCGKGGDGVRDGPHVVDDELVLPVRPVLRHGGAAVAFPCMCVSMSAWVVRYSCQDHTHRLRPRPLKSAAKTSHPPSRAR